MKTRKIVEGFEPYDYPEGSRRKYIRLDFGENTIGCSRKVIDRLRRVTAEDLSIYPEYNIVGKLASFLKIKPGNIILTNGSDDALRLMMEAYLDKDEEVILMEPSFSMFEFYAKLREAKVKKVLLGKDLGFDKNASLEAISDKTKAVVLCNPNNPTGTVIPRDAIIEIIEKTKGVVIVDEAYFDFYGESVIDLIETYDNLAVTRTFSKQAGLAGVRIGAAISNEKVISNLKKISSPFAVNALACIALDAALDDWKFVSDYVSSVKESKKFLFNEFRRLKIKTYPTQANFFIADFGEDVKKICSILKRQGILIRDRSSMPLLSGCARITIGTLEESKRLVSEIEKIQKLLNLDTLLFDMDGVLVDVSRSYRVAIKKTAESFMEKSVSFEEIQKYKERGGLNNDWDCTIAILKDNNVSVSKEEVIRRFDKIYLGGEIDNEKLIIDIEILERLSNRFRLGIVTGRPKRDADYTIDKFCLRRFFSTIITLDDVREGKPDPEGILIAKKALKGKNAIYIGDTVDDINAAKSAGIPCIGIVPPSPSENTKGLLGSAGAAIVLESINEICEVLR
ncbi:MAG: histidinol-phosphate transaminase [Nanoarchaeota archaeon]|nr:histidinol-phosphate transaminase [Nanoarchaeota archaeon]